MSSLRVVGRHARTAVHSALAGGSAVVVPGTGGYLLAATIAPVDLLSNLVAMHVGGGPLTLLVGRSAQAVALAAEWTDEVRRLTDRVWPGPLTVILTAHPDVPSAVVAGDGTVRLGVPDDRLVRRVSDESGPLVVATLCRTDGHPLTTVGEVLSHCGDAEIALVVDGGTCAGPGPTVVDCRVSPPEVLSEGKLPSTYVEAVLLMGTWRRKWFSKPAGDLR